jgi:hypothetical protein
LLLAVARLLLLTITGLLLAVPRLLLPVAGLLAIARLLLTLAVRVVGGAHALSPLSNYARPPSRAPRSQGVGIQDRRNPNRASCQTHDSATTTPRIQARVRGGIAHHLRPDPSGADARPIAPTRTTGFAAKALTG